MVPSILIVWNHQYNHNSVINQCLETINVRTHGINHKIGLINLKTLENFWRVGLLNKYSVKDKNPYIDKPNYSI